MYLVSGNSSCDDPISLETVRPKSRSYVYIDIDTVRYLAPTHVGNMSPIMTKTGTVGPTRIRTAFG